MDFEIVQLRKQEIGLKSALGNTASIVYRITTSDGNLNQLFKERP